MNIDIIDVLIIMMIVLGLLIPLLYIADYIDEKEDK